MNFSPLAAHFNPMHQFLTSVKPVNIQTDNIILAQTNASLLTSQNTNHAKFSDAHMLGDTTNGLALQFTQINNHENRAVVSRPTWMDVPNQSLIDVKTLTPLNIPSIASFQTGQAVGVQWPIKALSTQNASTMTECEKPASTMTECEKPASTMTECEKPENLSKSNLTNGDNDTDIQELPRTENNLVLLNSNTCSSIQLNRQSNAMAEYLARLEPSTIPENIKEFLNRQNLKIVQKSGENFGKKRQDTWRSNLGKLTITKVTIDGATLFCCPECQMAYPDKDLLDQHMTAHINERRFECNVCGACLKRKEHLDQHKRGHSEERPYVCEICCKGFKRNEHLRRHYIIHSGNKVYSCQDCGKSFSRKDHLNKHSQTHIVKCVLSDEICNSSLVVTQENS